MLSVVREADPTYAAAFYAEVGCDEDSYVRLIEACLPESGIAMTQEQIDSALPRWENNGSVKNTRADVSVSDIGALLKGMFVK
jgi:hypothetical protein